ncbi:MAG: hypothetical protein II007_00550 [Gammaproteobacteria bacterium]|nr:hypothetical protein [Gammaproteobacteria bacterium]
MRYLAAYLALPATIGYLAVLFGMLAELLSLSALQFSLLVFGGYGLYALWVFIVKGRFGFTSASERLIVIVGLLSGIGVATSWMARLFFVLERYELLAVIPIFMPVVSVFLVLHEK